jgi:hypothetical protein
MTVSQEQVVAKHHSHLTALEVSLLPNQFGQRIDLLIRLYFGEVNN